MKSKKGLGAIGWGLIVLVAIAIGIGVYLWFNPGGYVGTPQPPALPSG